MVDDNQDLLKRGVVPYLDQDEDDIGGDTDIGRFIPDSITMPGLPPDENEQMKLNRRELEQAGNRQFAKVHASHKSPKSTTAPGAEQSYGHNQKVHPIIGRSQRFEGLPPNQYHTQADLDNIKREQDKERQHRLGNVLSLGNKNRHVATPGMN